jgi:hypothetical protein
MYNDNIPFSYLLFTLVFPGRANLTLNAFSNE